VWQTVKLVTVERVTVKLVTVNRVTVKLLTVKRVTGGVKRDCETCDRERMFLHPLASSPCLSPAAGLPDEHIPMDLTEGDYLPLLSASCINARN
jgi:hypothetical protein